MKPNIVFVLLDSLRADSVGTSPGSAVQTPHLERLAADGVATDRCFSPYPVCGPYRCAMMTGRYAHTTGRRTNTDILTEHDENLLHLLRVGGYRVGWFGKNDLLDPAALEQSIDHRDVLQRPGTYNDRPWDRDDERYDSFYFGAKPQQYARAHDWDAVEHAKKFISSTPRETPFCAYLPFEYPHPPYNVAEPWFSLYDRATVPRRATHQSGPEPVFVSALRDAYGLAAATDETFAEIRATYYGMVSWCDHLIGELIEFLQAKGLYENTLVVVTSDHGDYLGDYGLVEKWSSGLTDNLLRVPLVIKPPAKPVDRGESTTRSIGGREAFAKALVEGIDLFPTLLDYSGIETDHRHFGKTLKPLIEGAAEQHRETVFADGGNSPQTTEDPLPPRDALYYAKVALRSQRPELDASAAMARTDEWKLIVRDDGPDELYRVQDDPLEEYNLIGADDHRSIREELRGRLLNWYLTTSDVPPRSSGVRDDPKYDSGTLFEPRQ